MGQVVILKGIHMTATEKRHVREMIEAEAQLARSKRKRYEVMALHTETFRVIIISVERDALNRRIERRNVLTVRYQRSKGK